jgi:mono/diheme cytochrome c family protein
VKDAAKKRAHVSGYNRLQICFKERGVGLKEFGVVAAGMLALAVWVSGNVSHGVLAQADSSTRDGVYTAEQAKQGKVLYEKQCANCHGTTLEGKGKNVPLVGNVFLDKWTDQTMADLFMKTNATMPASAPGTMSTDETAEVLAYILSVNKFQPGQKPLPTDPDELGAIHIAKP